MGSNNTLTSEDYYPVVYIITFYALFLLIVLALYIYDRIQTLIDKRNYPPSTDYMPLHNTLHL